MPKLKISKSITKRIKRVTKRGKILVLSTGAQHLASNKSKRRRKTANTQYAMTAGDKKRIKKVING